MSIINEALKKTQQVRKIKKEKRAAAEVKISVENIKQSSHLKSGATMTSHSASSSSSHIAVKHSLPNARKIVMPSNSISKSTSLTATKNLTMTFLKSEFWLTWKMALALTTTALLLMAYNHYDHLAKIKKSQLHTMTDQTQAKMKSTVAFEGVFVADNNARTALINKQPMQLGDTLNGMKIVAINQDTIDLQSDKGVVELKAGATYDL